MKNGEYCQYHPSLDNFDFVTLNGISIGFNITKENYR